MVNVGVGCVVRRRCGCAWAWARVVAGRACALPRVRCCCVPGFPVVGGASACPYPKPYVCHCLSYGRNWSRLGQDQAVIDKACGFVEVARICSDMNGSGRTRVPHLAAAPGCGMEMRRLGAMVQTNSVRYRSERTALLIAGASHTRAVMCIMTAHSCDSMRGRGRMCRASISTQIAAMLSAPIQANPGPHFPRRKTTQQHSPAVCHVLMTSI